jgi:tetratricopeptide (TPR) repeat protein
MISSRLRSSSLSPFSLKSPGLKRFRTACAGLALAVAALAVAPPAAAEPEKSTSPKAADNAPAPRDRSRDIQFLFGALKAAPDEDSAKLVEQRIMTLWLVSGSDTADLLMARSKAAIDGQDLDLALRLLDSIVDLSPNFAEAWNRRATVYFLKKDYGRALQDLQQVLAREPRHFGALAGLGMIMQEFGDDKRALEIFRRALDVNPHLARIPELVKSLGEKVDGRDI